MESERRELGWAEIGIAALAGVALLTFFGRKRRPNPFRCAPPARPLPGQPINNRTHHLLVYYDVDATPPSWAVVPKRINFFALGDGRNYPFTLRWFILGHGPGGQDVIFPQHAVKFQQASNQFSDGIVDKNGKVYLVNNLNTVDQEFGYSLTVELKSDVRVHFTADPVVKNGPNS